MLLLPLAQKEIGGGSFELESGLEKFLIYGSYPEVLNEPDLAKKAKILNELVSSYLFKDALALEAVRSPDTLIDVAKCLAFQIGGEVSHQRSGANRQNRSKDRGALSGFVGKNVCDQKSAGFFA